MLVKRTLKASPGHVQAPCGEAQRSSLKQGVATSSRHVHDSADSDHSSSAGFMLQGPLRRQRQKRAASAMTLLAMRIEECEGRLALYNEDIIRNIVKAELSQSVLKADAMEKRTKALEERDLDSAFVKQRVVQLEACVDPAIGPNIKTMVQAEVYNLLRSAASTVALASADAV